MREKYFHPAQLMPILRKNLFPFRPADKEMRRQNKLYIDKLAALTYTQFSTMLLFMAHFKLIYRHFHRKLDNKYA